MIYEMPGAPAGKWDNFEVRRMALRLQKSPFPQRIRRAKNGPEESRYVRLTQKNG
jgi:hypothetical protein